jgi:ABC-type multidrug transport system ATPase subunit
MLFNLARMKGKTIISTIHQPSSKAFYFFDRLVLMIDGNIVFQGPSTTSVEYFNSIRYPAPIFSNPADFFLKILQVDYPKQEKDEKKIEYLVSNYQDKLEKKVQSEAEGYKL